MSDSQEYIAITIFGNMILSFHFQVGYFWKNNGFLLNWLVKFPWLACSKKLGGAFCLPCVPFGKCTWPNCSKITCLWKSPFPGWSFTTRIFHDHQCKSGVHKHQFYQCKISGLWWRMKCKMFLLIEQCI